MEIGFWITVAIANLSIIIVAITTVAVLLRMHVNKRNMTENEAKTER